MKSTDVKAIYDGDYFLHAVDGCKEFSEFDGTFNSLFPRYQRNIQLLNLQPEHKFLEIGCGRGEVCIFHSLKGGSAKGVDYSADAIKLAREKAAFLGAKVEFIESSFDGLNEPPETYDRILASEFIEHISAEEGAKFFRAAFAMLRPGGKLLVFTLPNTLQRRYGYPIQRLWALLHGKRLPTHPDDTSSAHYALYHLNEQNYFSLKESARHTGFSKYSVGYDVTYSPTRSMVKHLVRYTIKLAPLCHIMLSNLFIIAEK